MSIRSFAVDLLPAKLHGLGTRAPLLPALPVPAHTPEVSTFDALAGKLGYLSKADFRKVREAYKFADQAHLGQLRASGAPYITHPVAVAGLVADWKLDAQALMAAL
ncbi:MAG TPA: HD domain-containing protein, partial [Burkholderiaceae bacterium]|nr:HD domain-containing protein [Burkholderiaceae bacterium]